MTDATQAAEPELVDWFRQFVDHYVETNNGPDQEALIAVLDRVRDSYRREADARPGERAILSRLVATIPVRTGPGGAKQFLGNTCRMLAVRDEAVAFLAGQPSPPLNGHDRHLIETDLPNGMRLTIVREDAYDAVTIWSEDGESIFTSAHTPHLSRLSPGIRDAERLRTAIEALLPVGRANTRLGKAGNGLRLALDAVEDAVAVPAKDPA